MNNIAYSLTAYTCIDIYFWQYYFDMGGLQYITKLQEMCLG